MIKTVTIRDVSIFLALILAISLFFGAQIAEGFDFYSGAIYGVASSKITTITAFSNGSPISLVSTDEELNQINFLAEVTVGFGADVLNAQSIGNELEGVTVKRNAKLTIENVRDTYHYPISNQQIGIRKFSIVKVGVFQGCPLGTTYAIPSTLYGLETHCIIESQVGMKGILTAPYYKTDISPKLQLFTPSGSLLETIQVDVTNIPAGSISEVAELRDNSDNFLGTVTFLGTYSEDQSAPNEAQVVAVYKDSIKRWNIVSEDTYDDYDDILDESRTAFSDFIREGFGKDLVFSLPGLLGVPITCTGSDCETQIENIVSKLNDRTDALFAARDEIPIQTTGAVQSFSSQDLENGTYRVYIHGGVWKKPNLVFSLVAEALQLELQTGVPVDIRVSPQIVEIPAGDSNPITLTVDFRSSGGTGSYEAGVENCSAFASSDSTVVKVPANQWGKIFLTLVPRSQGKVSLSTCTVRVSDTTKPSNSGTATFEGGILELQSCAPNAYDVRNDSIYKCKTDGSGWFLFSTCTNGVRYVDGVPQCSEDTVPVCGDDICEVPETKENCPGDCDSEIVTHLEWVDMGDNVEKCSLVQKPGTDECYPEGKIKGGQDSCPLLYNWRISSEYNFTVLGAPIPIISDLLGKTDTSGCVPDYILIFLLMVGLLVLIYIIVNSKMFRKKITKKKKKSKSKRRSK